MAIRIGQYGDKMMEGDYHVGQILDVSKEIGVDDNTLLVFASDNGPCGEAVREFGNQGTPDMGNAGPFRGRTGGSDRGRDPDLLLRALARQGQAGHTSNATFSIMDFMPTFAQIIGTKMPTDRAIDGVDQTDVLFGRSEAGNRDSLLSFIGADLVAVRSKQWRVYFTDVHPTGTGLQARARHVLGQRPMAGYPKVFNIEMDPHEVLVVGGLFTWTPEPALEVVKKYSESL